MTAGRVGRATPVLPPRSRDPEAGSTLPLILGYVVLALMIVAVCVCATDLYIAQKRLESVADAAALAGADGFTLEIEGEGVRAVLADAAVAERAGSVANVLDDRVVLVAADSPDGVSARVTVRMGWSPPVLSSFVPAAVMLEATATSRTALR
ncbi:hypothetical protein J2Y69_000037 [Microbacterium resistens]|uniref:Putative Flp pilus-assembly TadG-like N-terminal domain-containing protein n=1 Tax=Microbacterium resistens TaxID=156977 RepID=A0ABU1S7F3_9MICO|nr:pilus assembly protein TadG-related protein [Microbacterium resistens]MDR6865455.1 hypothetical protein [Microbacterium resistens]